MSIPARIVDREHPAEHGERPGCARVCACWRHLTSHRTPEMTAITTYLNMHASDGHSPLLLVVFSASRRDKNSCFYSDTTCYGSNRTLRLTERRGRRLRFAVYKDSLPEGVRQLSSRAGLTGGSTRGSEDRPRSVRRTSRLSPW